MRLSLFSRPGGSIALLALAAALAGCGGGMDNVSGWASKVAHPESRQPKDCAGWQKIELKGHTRYLLLQKDQKLVVNIDAHNLRGRNLGCWN